MTISELLLYAHDRLEKEWYETPKCDQMRQAFEHINEEMFKAIMDCINQAYNQRGNNNDQQRSNQNN